MGRYPADGYAGSQAALDANWYTNPMDSAHYYRAQGGEGGAPPGYSTLQPRSDPSHKFAYFSSQGQAAPRIAPPSGFSTMSTSGRQQHQQQQQQGHGAPRHGTLPRQQGSHLQDTDPLNYRSGPGLGVAQGRRHTGYSHGEKEFLLSHGGPD